MYSQSGVTTFDLGLYKGTPSPVMFDKQGWIPLGCKIHDHMRGHIYVLDTRHFVVTKRDGRWAFRDVPHGDYDVFVWHPLLAETWDKLKPRLTELKQTLAITAENPKPLEFSLKLLKDWTPARRPGLYPKDVGQ